VHLQRVLVLEDFIASVTDELRSIMLSIQVFSSVVLVIGVLWSSWYLLESVDIHPARATTSPNILVYSRVDFPVRAGKPLCFAAPPYTLVYRWFAATIAAVFIWFIV
jgi:hypothetical protein